MNVVNIVECGICGSKTKIKVQLGEVYDFYIFVPCLKCKSIINGIAHLKPPTYNFDFNNLKVINENSNNYDYYAECSSELVVCKPKILFNKDDSHVPIFFRNTEFVDNVLKVNPFYLVSKYTNNINEKWKYNYNLIKLYLNENYELLCSKIKENSEESYENKLDLVFYKHLLYRKTFDLFFSFKSYDLNDFSKKFEKEFLNLDINQIDNVIEIMQQRNMFDILNCKFLDLTSKITKKIIYIIPGLTSQFFDNEIDYNEYGISTCMPDDIVDLYKDCYEVISIIIPIIEMLNNIKVRMQFDDYATEKQNIENSFKKSNGEKINSLNYDEFYSSIFCKKLDKTIRNSIGHNNYLYDPIKQEITFIDMKKEKKLYLLQFVNECINTILTFINVENLFFYLERRKIYNDGERSKNVLTEYKRKYGRNEKCACGSGLKYKRCHGISN